MLGLRAVRLIGQVGGPRGQFDRANEITFGMVNDPLAAEGTPFAEVSFLVVDVETTGVSAWAGDRITEVAAVLVRGGEVREAFHSLINPGRRIPSFITQLTGIDDAMVRHAPPFGEVAGALAYEMVGRVFVAHNARFDWNFLSAEYDRVASAPLKSLTGDQLCTVRLARRFLSHLPRRNLDAVAHHYGVEIEGRHRAMGDARATAHVLIGLLRDAELRGLYTWEALDELMRRRTSRARKRRSAMPSATDGRDGA
jgi:DNA polymerase-3 subunit epsilon